MKIQQTIYPGRDLNRARYTDDLYEIHGGLEALQTCLDDLHVSLSNYLSGKEILCSGSDYNKSKALNRSVDEHPFKSLSEINRRYFRRHVYLHGHSFVYCLDKYYKVLKGMKKLKTITRNVGNALAEFEVNLPSLTAVRNSAQHFEDRYKQKSRDKIVTAKPFSVDGFASTAGNIFMVSTFINDKLTYTSEDGTLGTVDISKTTLTHAVENFQNFINSLSWVGPSRTLPD